MNINLAPVMESQKYEISVDLDEDDITDEEEINNQTISNHNFHSLSLPHSSSNSSSTCFPNKKMATVIKCKGRGFTDSYSRTIYTCPIPPSSNQNTNSDASFPLKNQSGYNHGHQNTLSHSILSSHSHSTFAIAPSSTFPSSLEDSSIKYQKSIEGWVLFVSGLHEEITEDDLHDKFSEHGHITDLKLELDHKTGYVKGYALIEYENYNEALATKEALNGTLVLDVPIRVDFAYLNNSFCKATK